MVDPDSKNGEESSGVSVREATRAEMRDMPAVIGALSSIEPLVDTLSDADKADIVGELSKFANGGIIPPKSQGETLALPDGEEDEVLKRVELLEDENKRLRLDLAESRAKSKKLEDIYKKERFVAYTNALDLVLGYVECIKTRDAIHTMLDAVSNLENIV